MKKLKQNKGFTLVEMLACVVTLSLVCMICMTGTGLSIKSYNESRFESDSQKLEASIELVLGDILRYAEEITVNASDAVIFSNTEYGIVQGSLLVKNEKFAVKRKAEAEDTVALITPVSYADNLYIDGFQLSYNSTDKLFTGSYNIKSKVTNVVKSCTFSFRTIAE